VIILLAIPLSLVLIASCAYYIALHTTTGARWLLSAVPAQVPGTLEIAETEGDLSSGLLLRNVRYSEPGFSVAAGSLDLAVSPGFFPLTVTIDRLNVRALQLELAADESGAPPENLPASLALPFPLSITELSVDGFVYLDEAGGPALLVDRIAAAADIHENLRLYHLEVTKEDSRLRLGGIIGLAEPFPIDLELDSELFLALEEPGGTAEFSANTKLDGNIRNYTISSSGQAMLPGFDEFQFEVKAGGGLNGMNILSLDLAGTALELAASGELDWEDGVSARVTSTLKKLDPSAWVDDWPKAYPLSGEIDLSFQDQAVRVLKFNLSVSDSELSLQGSGDADFLQETLAGEIFWKGFAWPLDSERPDIRSASGQVLLSGTIDDWKADGEIELESAGLPPGTLRFETSGNRERADMVIVDGRVLGGTLSGDAEFDWSREQRWSVRLLADNIQTGGLVPDLPGFVNADLDARGKLEPLQLDLNIRRLDGEIIGLPLTAGGRLQFEPGMLDFSDLFIESEGSVFSVNGSAYGPRGAVFTATIAGLDSFLPNSSGSIQAQGRLSLQNGNPWLELGLEGQDLVWDGARLLDSVSLNIGQEGSGQTIQLTARSSGLEFSTHLSGSLETAGQALTESTWKGQLQELEFREEGQPLLGLLEPAPVELSASRLAVSAACLRAGTDSRFCLEAGWKQGGLFSAAARLERVSLELIDLLLETDLEFSQYAEGELSWEAGFNRLPSGRAEIRLSPGNISYKGDTETLITTGEGLVGFELNEGRLSAGNFDVPLPGQGEIDLDFSLADVSAGLDAELEGRLKIGLADLDILTLFLPILDQANGRFDANLGLSGTGGQPYFSGRILLEDGLLRHDASGLSLHDIQLSGQVIGNGETQLDGRFSAVEGTGRLQALLDLSEVLSPRIEVSVEGENLTLFDTPDLTVVAEPDIHLQWHDGVIDIDGSLLIPSARIAPSVIRQASVAESRDLVIVVGEMPGSEDGQAETSDLAIRGNLEVTLGKDVELDISVLEADVSGSVNFSWQDESIPLANGSYSMVGEILAFGQLLQITRANIGFPGVPADNPHLSIRAERQIYGNSEVRRAGIFVTGTLKRPVLEPYTEPMTNRERAQTLLITGSDFNMETGVGAVDIGTYIAPRIFVSYGIGVFEDENVISIRYDLGRNWGIKATSGQRQTGVDVSYTIER